MRTRTRVTVCLVGVLALSHWAVALDAAAADLEEQQSSQQAEEVRVFALQHVHSGMLKPTLESLFEHDGIRLADDSRSNQLVAFGGARTLDRLAEVVKILDGEPADHSLSPVYNIGVTVWEIGGEAKDQFDALVKQKVDAPLPLHLPRDECDTLVKSLADAGVISQPVRMQCGLLAEQEVQMESGARVAVEKGRATGRDGLVTKNYSYESMGCVVRMRLRQVTGGIVAELLVEDSRLVPAEAGGGAQDEPKVDATGTPFTVTSSTFQTVLALADGDAALYSTGGGSAGLRLLYLVTITPE
ncbi:hypothetical protein KOR34_31040 [Posidoniimonas corsicana]|uniref:Bacterial type II/III secretion system short domain protein n=1 Tax=Posidoniimonas corsicana TaxID=1938618 RepID=A0A5C5VHS8_9BACT|nr:hypothetical protein [Posidoniimonas corsicana]TWT38136.1 hypothetical protein KOR34_31040 [Posidoniimonas corsicana]